MAFLRLYKFYRAGGAPVRRALRRAWEGITR
jgi:hypothetical protein